MATTPFTPLVSFHYQVEWGGTRVGFTEVSGLNPPEVQAIEYREGDDPEYIATQIPGMRKVADVTLKRGIADKDNSFFQWLITAKLNKVERRDITVSLLNENHEPVMVWNIAQAWVTKVESPSLKSTGNEIAVESITLKNQGITITMP